MAYTTPVRQLTEALQVRNNYGGDHLCYWEDIVTMVSLRTVPTLFTCQHCILIVVNN